VFDDPEAAFEPGVEVPWLQPLPDAILGTPPSDPAELAVERDRVRLAVGASLQLLTPRQRAVLVLREVLDIPAAEVGEMLDMTTAAVNSAGQRARAAVAAAGTDRAAPAEPLEHQRPVVEAWIVAFEAADVDALARLVRDDIVLEMPPMWNWYRGRSDYGAFMARIFRTRGTSWRALLVGTNGQPGIAAYRELDDGRFGLHTVQVFDVGSGMIGRLTVFQDPHVHQLFELPPSLPR
jgi:RNA polymerase sigma-70 factor (ECF subfamily)